MNAKNGFKILFTIIFIQFLFLSCISSGGEKEESISNFVKGADISWLPQMENSGFKFYDKNGNQKDCLTILKENGINTIRLRTWVNPSEDAINGHCNSSETIKMAKRAFENGFDIMIDFHYSDSWADPSKQVKAAAWNGHTITQLQSDVYNYTYKFMEDLKLAGVKAKWVQIGNEINPGMMLPEGSSNDMPALSKLINSGYDAVKKSDSNSKVVVHLSSGADNSLFRWFFDGLKNNDTKYDVIGMSYYPYWDGKSYTANIDSLENNMQDMIKRYNKEIMIVETGEKYNKADESYNMIREIIKRVKKLPESKGIGVMYWEPEGAVNWSNYELSCWESSGKPTKALEAFIE